MDDNSKRKGIPSKGWLIAFAVPFLIVGGLTVWHWYDYGLQDIHTARLRVWKEGESVQQPGDHWESLKFALMMGTACGVGAGVIGLGFFGLTKLVKRKS